MTSTGHLLRMARTSRGLTQGQAAGLYGITQATLSSLERDKRVFNSKTMGKVADALGVSSEAIIFATAGIPVELNEKEAIVYKTIQSSVSITIILGGGNR